MDRKPERRSDSDRGYSGCHRFSGTVFYGKVVYTMIDISKLSKSYSVRILEESDVEMIVDICDQNTIFMSIPKHAQPEKTSLTI